MPSPSVPLATQDYVDSAVGAIGPGGGGGGGNLNIVAVAGSGATALTAAANVAGQPHLPPGTRTIDASVTLIKPLSFAVGAILKPAAGVTVTLPAVTAGRRQIFDLSLGGAIAFTGGRATDVYPEWWGVTFDNTTDGVANGNALRAIAGMFTLGAGGQLSLPMGTCRYTGLVQWKSDVSIGGPGKTLCTLRGMDAAAHFYLYDEQPSGRRGQWYGFTVDGNNVSDFGIRWRRGANYMMSDIRVVNARTNWSIEGVQNSDLFQCDSVCTTAFTQIGIRVTDGAQHINWYGGTFKDAVTNLYVTQDIEPPLGQAARPEHINFHGCVIERATGRQVLIDAGSPVRFRGGSTSDDTGISNGHMVIRRRVNPLGTGCAKVTVIVDDFVINAAYYSIDAQAASTVGPLGSISGKPATVWASTAGSSAYPVALLYLEGSFRPGPYTAVVHADQAIDVGGTMLSAQASVPLVAPAPGSTKAKLDHSIYGYGAFRASFSDTGTGATVLGSFSVPILEACELLETVIVTVGDPVSPITATPKRVKAAGGVATIYAVAPTLAAPNEVSTALVAKPTETYFARGDLVKVDALAPAGKDFTVTMRWRRT